jgi:hypothetical protein
MSGALAAEGGFSVRSHRAMIDRVKSVVFVSASLSTPRTKVCVLAARTEIELKLVVPLPPCAASPVRAKGR